MFKKNVSHLQANLFSFINQLDDKKQKKLLASEEYFFYQIIFCNINEDDFSKLYSDKYSRPNAPINAMVASLILMQRRGWTYEQLFNHIDFDILTKIALGLTTLNETPFCSATLYNFQNRLLNHYIKTDENLIEQVFDGLTQEQLKVLKIKTDIQRCDSFLAASNIRSYSRLQLLIEVLIRLYRILVDEDKKKFHSQFETYTKQTSGQYIYRINRSDFPHELDKLGQIYHYLYQELKSNYADKEVFKIFLRVYTEHFTIVEDKLQVISSDELGSDILQSPDDLDASYRKKKDQESRGQTVHVSETAHPDNQVNLLTDVVVEANNTDDADILNKRLEKMKEKTPDLDELHTDGGYGSPKNDIKMEKLEIIHIQTAIKGRKSVIDFNIKQKTDDTFLVSCPNQTIHSEKTKTRYKACFDKEQCAKCPFAELCPTIPQKNCRVYYFIYDDYLRKKRHHNIELIPHNRRKIRPNVEATVHEFKCKMQGNKLKVRGAFKTALFAFTMAISINFGRIYRFVPNTLKNNNILQLYNIIIIFLCMIFIKYIEFVMNSTIEMKNKKYIHKLTLITKVAF